MARTVGRPLFHPYSAKVDQAPGMGKSLGMSYCSPAAIPPSRARVGPGRRSPAPFPASGSTGPTGAPGRGSSRAVELELPLTCPGISGRLQVDFIQLGHAMPTRAGRASRR